MNAPILSGFACSRTRALYTVVTSSGLRLCAWATSPEDACARVHGAVRAWEGFEPLPPPANENGRPFGPEDVSAFVEDEEA